MERPLLPGFLSFFFSSYELKELPAGSAASRLALFPLSWPGPAAPALSAELGAEANGGEPGRDTGRRAGGERTSATSPGRWPRRLRKGR